MTASTAQRECAQNGKQHAESLAIVAAMAASPPLRLKPVWQEPMANHTSVRVGGPADLLVRVRSQQGLRAIAAAAYRYSLPFRVLGDGTNLIAAPAGIRGLVIRNHGGERHRCADGVSIWADSGCSLIGTARWAAGMGLSGLEGAATIPGTVGGAVVNNAGAYGWTASDSVTRVKVLDCQGERWMEHAELQYAYRTSAIKEQPGYAVVLGAEMLLTPGDAHRILATVNERLETRHRTQPTAPSSGSVFRNPPGCSAWKLIDQAGMRGMAVGGAHVSQKHANFIINDGTATASDVHDLVQAVEEAVRSRMRVELQREVELIGSWER